MLTITPLLMKMLATFTASSSRPPPLPLRSRTIASTLSLVMAVSTDRAELVRRLLVGEGVEDYVGHLLALVVHDLGARWWGSLWCGG